MSKKPTILILATVLACAAVSWSLLAQAPGSETAEAAAVLADAPVDRQIETLLAMPADERRATLKQMSPDQRRGLWFRLKRAEVREKSSSRKAYRDLVGTNRTSRSTAPPAKLAGTIQYDDGVVNTTFGGGAIIGNRFDTHDGGVQVTASGTVDTVVAVVVEGPAFTSTTAGFVLLGPQTGGGGAMAIFSTFTTAIAGTTDTVTFAGLGASYTGSSFFVLFGDFASINVPAFGTGSTNGQGFHGVVGYTGGMGPNITGTFDFGGTRNGLVRVTGNVLPVELMSFDVE